MCEVCEKSIYFDKVIHHSDGGYGDDDWDDKFQYKVNDFICPACGRLKPSAIKMFGSAQKALMYLKNTPYHTIGLFLFFCSVSV